jgi:hypothetical protein
MAYYTNKDSYLYLTYITSISIIIESNKEYNMANLCLYQDYGVVDILENIGSDLKSFVMALPFVTSQKDIPRKSGVYFLVSEIDEVMYIGKSVNIYKRWMKRKDFSLEGGKRLYLLCGEFPLEAVEAIFILLILPTFNKSVRVTKPQGGYQK